MKSFSITGNLYVDGMIATTAFAMAKGWLEIIVTVFKTIFEFLYLRVKYYVVKGLSSRFGGKELFEVEYKAPCEIFYFLKKFVLTQKGDDLSQQFKRLYIKSLVDPHYWWSQTNADDYINASLEVDYIGTSAIVAKEDHNIFAKNKIYFRHTYENQEYIIQLYEFDESYYRKYWDYMEGNYGKKTEQASTDTVAAKPMQSSNTTIKMEVVCFTDLVPTRTTMVNIVESFLNEKFHMQEHLYRCYTINLDSAVATQILTALKRGTIRLESCLSVDHVNFKVINKFMDGILRNNNKRVDENNMSSLSTMQLNVKQLHSGFKYQDQIKLANRSSQRSLDCAYALVDRYIHRQQTGYNEALFTYEDNLAYFSQEQSTGFYTIHIVTQGKKLTEPLVKDILQWLIELSFKASKNTTITKNQVSVHKREQGEWMTYILSMRTFDSIYLPKTLMGVIRNEFDGFIEIEKLYREYQIPYKKGILFYGPPGTGKTSLVKALAFEYQLPLYIIDVNDEEINDESIVTILNGLGNSGLKLLLFEDIDTAFADKEKVKNETKLILDNQPSDISSKSSSSLSDTKPIQTIQQQSVRKKFLTYSGLLNALDGVMSNQSGVITIMTTNYLERLGPAFLRPGRIDVKFELRECNAEQIEDMTRTFLVKRLDMSDKFFASNGTEPTYTQAELDRRILEFVGRLNKANIKPCELQFYLLRYIRNIQDIFDNYTELLTEPTLEDSNKVIAVHSVQ